MIEFSVEVRRRIYADQVHVFLFIRNQGLTLVIKLLAKWLICSTNVA